MTLRASTTGSFNNIGSDACDICFRAEQSRSVFPISSNKATSCFDLIHYDILGAIKSFTGSHYFLSIVDDASRGT